MAKGLHRIVCEHRKCRQRGRIRKHRIERGPSAIINITKEIYMRIPKKLFLTLISAIVFAGFAVSDGYAQPGRASFGGNNGRHLGWSRGQHRGWNRGRKVGFGDRRFNRGRFSRGDRRRFDDRRLIFRNSRNRSIRNRRIFLQNDRRRFSNRRTRRNFVSRLY